MHSNTPLHKGVVSRGRVGTASPDGLDLPPIAEEGPEDLHDLEAAKRYMAQKNMCGLTPPSCGTTALCFGLAFLGAAAYALYLTHPDFSSNC